MDKPVLRLASIDDEPQSLSGRCGGRRGEQWQVALFGVVGTIPHAPLSFVAGFATVGLRCLYGSRPKAAFGCMRWSDRSCYTERRRSG